MHHDREPSIAALRTASPSRALRRVADALGVPVSSFNGSADPEEAAVLATVQSYLQRASPSARDRFVAMVQTMIKLPSA
jgi:hypothetical protein